MAIGPAIAAILAGLAAGAAEGTVKRRQKEDEITRQIMQKSAFERASKGDVGFADNPDMSKHLGKQGVQALLSYAQQIQQQNAETERGDIAARTQMFGTDPLGGLAIGKHGGTMAGTGGGPTVTGGPGGAVSVQQPGTGRTIPPIRPDVAPEAALAQSVVGPAAGPADEPPIGEPVPLPPMGPAAIPPQGAPAAPAARPQTGLDRIQQGLAEGQSVTGKVGGMGFSTHGLGAGEKADAIGRRIIAEGLKAGKRPDEMVLDVFAGGGKLPENFNSLSEAHFMKGVRERMKTIGADIKSLSMQQKIAITEEAMEGGGRAPDAWKSMVGITKADEHALAGEVVERAMREGGLAFGRARDYAAARGLKLSNEDEVAMGQRWFGEVMTAYQKLEPDLSPQQLAQKAAIAVGNDPRFIPPDMRAMIREPAPVAPETAARITEEGGRQPLLSDTDRRTDVAGARRRAEAEATGTAATRAGAVKQEQENVLERMPQGAQEALKAVDTSIALGQRIFSGYKPEYVGPTKARIDYLKEKFIDKSLPPGESAFRANVHDFVNTAIFQLTGKQVGSMSEAERLQFPLPNLNLPPSVFEERLSNLRKSLHDKRQIEAGMGRSQGYRPAPPPPETTEERAAPAPGAAPTISPEEQRLRKRLGIK